MGARPVVLFSLPVDISGLFASVAEEAGLFPTVEVEWLVTVHQLIYLIYPYIFQCLAHNKFKPVSSGHFPVNLLSPGFDSLNLLRSEYQLLPYLHFHIPHHSLLLCLTYGCQNCLHRMTEA